MERERFAPQFDDSAFFTTLKRTNERKADDRFKVCFLFNSRNVFLFFVFQLSLSKIELSDLKLFEVSLVQISIINFQRVLHQNLANLIEDLNIL